MRRTVTILVFLFAPVLTAFAADETPSATLAANGSVYLNGQQLTGLLAQSIPVSVGDIVQTREESLAQFQSVRSIGTVASNSLVRVQQGGFTVDRGGMRLATGQQSSIFARDFKITPTSTIWTKFQVLRTGGIIQVMAEEKDVLVSCGVGRPVLLKQGHQLSRTDAGDCGLAEKSGGAPVAAKGPILASPVAEKAGILAGAGLLGWILTKPEDPISPYRP